MSFSFSVSGVAKNEFASALTMAKAESIQSLGQGTTQIAAADAAVEAAIGFVDENWPNADRIGCSISGHAGTDGTGQPGDTVNISIQSLSTPVTEPPTPEPVTTEPTGTTATAQTATDTWTQPTSPVDETVAVDAAAQTEQTTPDATA